MKDLEIECEPNILQETERSPEFFPILFESHFNKGNYLPILFQKLGLTNKLTFRLQYTKYCI